MTIMSPKDSVGNQLYSQSAQGMDPKYPDHGLSNDHIMAKRNEIINVHKHPVNKLPRPSGGGEAPNIKPAKKVIDDSSHFGDGNRKQPVK